MPQMMPIYWFVICMVINLSIHFFFSFYYHNFLIFSFFSSSMKKSSEVLNFLK